MPVLAHILNAGHTVDVGIEFVEAVDDLPDAGGFAITRVLVQTFEKFKLFQKLRDILTERRMAQDIVEHIHAVLHNTRTGRHLPEHGENDIAVIFLLGKPRTEKLQRQVIAAFIAKLLILSRAVRRPHQTEIRHFFISFRY